MEIIITEMNLSDLDNISNILYSDFDDFWNYNIFKSELENPNSKYIIAKHNDEIVGFAGITILIDKADITNIVTKKKYRNNNIGSKQLEYIIELCKSLNLTELSLEVANSNIPAINLYKKFNFEICGLRKKYYNNTEDAIIMTKKIDNEFNKNKS